MPVIPRSPAVPPPDRALMPLSGRDKDHGFARPSFDKDQCAQGWAWRKLRHGHSAGGHVTLMKSALSKTWSLVLNGSRCRILRGVANTSEQAPPELVMRSESRKLRDIMSDKPGRSFSSGSGGRRSAMEYASDPVGEDQRDFVRQVIALLESHRRAGDFDRLAIFAEHDMLGQLREMMPKALADMVVREVPKNLLHLSAQELAEAVSRSMPDGSGAS
jgi:protein required for attachment to host cells